jgi:GMP synthase-like glutamine amidotransferase
MRSIVICRFAPTEGPGYFATYLSAHRIPWRLLKLDEGDALPRVDELAGLAMMGGPMSVNDDLAWIAPTLDLVRESVAQGVPVIGHCLGGQMLAKALGARVMRNPVKEIGWGEIAVHTNAAARRWSPAGAFLSFHWHGETFALPAGAERIWSSSYCENQGYVIGPHVGMQCHIEMTRELIETWCDTGEREIEESAGSSPAVQRAGQMMDRVDDKVASLHAVADRVYSEWIKGLKLAG